MMIRQWLSARFGIVRLYWNAGAQARKNWDNKRHEKELYGNDKH